MTMSTLVQNPDYAEEGEYHPLALKLYDQWDDDDHLWIKRKLEALVHQHITPRQAALDMDTRIRAITRRDRHDGTTAQLFPEFIGPFFRAFTKLCSAFPPYHAGQDQLIALVKTLHELPRHIIPEGLSPAEIEEKPYITTTLWAFEDRNCNWQGSAEAFDFEIVYVLAPYRLRNYNAAMARLTCAGLIDCGFLSALCHLLPADDEYPDLAKRPVDGPNKLGNYLIAAAQWVLGPEECRYVYVECQKVERVGGDNPREIWSREHWAEWKRQFDFVAGDERFAHKYRSIAAQAYHHMIKCEKEEGLRREV